MEQLENITVQPEIKHRADYEEYDNYIEHLAEEDDRRYEDEIFERMSE